MDIETPRLRLVSSRWQDVELQHDVLADDRLALLPWTMRGDTIAAYRKATALPSSHVIRALNQEQAEIGIVEFAAGSLFFFVRQPWRGGGLASEMVTAACSDMAMQQLGLNLIRARVLRENTPSVRVVTKAGFVFSRLALLSGRTILEFERRRGQPVTPLPS